MKKFAVVICLTTIISISCVPLFPPTAVPNEPPVAYLDVVPPISTVANTVIYLAGHGADTDGYIKGYEWSSSIDGIINNTARFSTSKLSTGRHTIYFRVQDDKGYWSRQAYTYVNIMTSYEQKPVIYKFELSPLKVLTGKSTVLNWDVGYALKVNISPDIGDVSSSGTRLIYPKTDTNYVITAVNSLGTVTKEVALSVITEQIIPLELYSISSESGSLGSGLIIGRDPRVGVANSALPWQAFFSFDISVIPKTAIVKSASLDLSNYIIIGYPFNFLGAMGIFHHEYGVLDISDYYDLYPGGAIYTTYSVPYLPFVSTMITDAVQQQVNKGVERFQVRVQFEKYYFGNVRENYLQFSSDLARLHLTYQE